MGAWIETRLIKDKEDMTYESHPTWVRGLKPTLVSAYPSSFDVASYMGAWIETSAAIICN